MLTIDCQVHPFAAETADKKWTHAHDDGRKSVNGDEMVMAMDAVGVDGGIAVSPRGMYGFDPSYVVTVQKAHPDRFAIVRPVDAKDPAVGEQIAEWKRTAGAVAVRLMMGGGAVEADAPGIATICKEATRHGLGINLQLGGNLNEKTMSVVDRFPDTRFALDHLAFRQPRKMPATPEAWADLPKLLDLAKRPNAFVKVSGACAMSAQPYPYDDIFDNLLRVFDAFGFERCMWGTDWTRTYTLFPYINAVDPFRLSKRISESDKVKLMGETCAKFYNWKPKSTYQQRHPHGRD